MTDIVSAVKGFLSKHSGELATLTGVVREVTNALPIGAQDKAKITTALDGLDTASNNIAKAVDAISGEAPQVVIKRSDLDAALTDVLPGILPALIASEIARQKAAS